MFSQKMICAIGIMNVIARNTLPGPGRKTGIDITQLQKEVDMDSAIYRSVKSMLIKKGVIRSISRRVVLGEIVEELSLMDLMLIFHAGLPLGSVFESDYGRRNYMVDSMYDPFRRFEHQTEKALAKQFEAVLVMKTFCPRIERK